MAAIDPVTGLRFKNWHVDGNKHYIFPLLPASENKVAKIKGFDPKTDTLLVNASRSGGIGILYEDAHEIAMADHPGLSESDLNYVSGRPGTPVEKIDTHRNGEGFIVHWSHKFLKKGKIKSRVSKKGVKKYANYVYYDANGQEEGFGLGGLIGVAKTKYPMAYIGSKGEPWHNIGMWGSGDNKGLFDYASFWIDSGLLDKIYRADGSWETYNR